MGGCCGVSNAVQHLEAYRAPETPEGGAAIAAALVPDGVDRGSNEPCDGEPINAPPVIKVTSNEGGRGKADVPLPNQLEVSHPMIDSAPELVSTATAPPTPGGRTAAEERLTEDGGVKKAVVIPGQGTETAPHGCLATVDYIGMLDDGTQFESTHEYGEPLQFRVGAGEVVPGLDIAVRSMRRGEQAVIVCAPQYAYGDHGIGGKVPPHATVMLILDLRTWAASFSDGALGEEDPSPAQDTTTEDPRPSDAPPADQFDASMSPWKPGPTDSTPGPFISLTSDGEVQKSVVQASSGPAVPGGINPRVHFVVLLEDGTQVGSTYTDETGPVLVQDDDVAVPRAVALAARSMRRGERALVRSTARYAGPQPPAERLLFVVDLVGWEPTGCTSYPPSICRVMAGDDSQAAASAADASDVAAESPCPIQTALGASLDACVETPGAAGPLAEGGDHPAASESDPDLAHSTRCHMAQSTRQGPTQIFSDDDDDDDDGPPGPPPSGLGQLDGPLPAPPFPCPDTPEPTEEPAGGP